MSLLPMLYSNWWEDLESPHSLVDQHFGLGVNPENLPFYQSPRRHCYANSPRSGALTTRCPMGIYVRPSWAEKSRQIDGRGASTVKAEKNQFQVSLDVQQFMPEEISVKVVDRTVIVEGKHDEKQDEHGWISRQFSRRYIVPEQCDIEQVVSKLSSDGVLSITVPRKDVPKVENERSIKIVHTGKPAIRENGDAAKPAETQAPKENEKK